MHTHNLGGFSAFTQGIVYATACYGGRASKEAVAGPRLKRGRHRHYPGITFNAFWSTQQVQVSALRSRALLIGAGWTLAAPAALTWFNLGDPAPIYLWSLWVVALGWAVILLQALAGAERAASVALALAEDETRYVLDGMARAMGGEIQGACSELTRVDELLAHAIAQLMTAFNSVSDQVYVHQRELARQAAVAQGTPAAQRLRAAAERVASDVNGVITALQFRDVVGQKLGHVRRELEALGQMLQRIRDLSAAQSGRAAARNRPQVQAELEVGVRSLLRELEQPRAATPVRQELMHAGEVELF